MRVPAPTYLDSNVISYLTSRPSRDVVSLAHQQLTREWWDRQRENFELHISELVAFEISRGDASAANERLKFVSDFPFLRITVCRDAGYEPPIVCTPEELLIP